MEDILEILDYDIFQLLAWSAGGRKIVAFGAGKFLENFCKKYSNYGLEHHIERIIDNNSNIIGSYKRIGVCDIPVVNIMDGMKSLGEDGIILISTLHLKDVLAQLASYDVHKVVFLGFVIDKFIERDLKNEDVKYDVVSDTDFNIPKVIHYCWFGKGKLPDRYREWMSSWKKFCPDYEVVEWNESNYDVHKNRYMSEAYEAKKWGFVSDYARLDIIYTYGGIYLDTDVEVIRSFDGLLHQKAFAGLQFDGRVALGLGFGSVPGNDIIRVLRDDYNAHSFIKQDGSFNLTTCPTYQTAILRKYGLQLRDEFQLRGEVQCLKDINIYPPVFFTPMTIYARKIVRNQKFSFSIHHYDGSWVDDKKKAHARFRADLYRTKKVKVYIENCY